MVRKGLDTVITEDTEDSAFYPNLLTVDAAGDRLLLSLELGQTRRSMSANNALTRVDTLRSTRHEALDHLGLLAPHSNQRCALM